MVSEEPQTNDFFLTLKQKVAGRNRLTWYNN